MDADFIIDRQMRLLGSQRYYGQAVPHHYVERSASAMAAVLGADMEFVDKETIWAYPCSESVERVAEIAASHGRPSPQVLEQCVALGKALAQAASR